MKIVGTIAKLLAAIAAVAGAVYLIATYGDKIVAWAKKMLGCCCNCDCECECCENGECCCEGDCETCEEVEEAAEEAAEEATEDAAPADDACTEADFAE